MVAVAAAAQGQAVFGAVMAVSAHLFEQHRMHRPGQRRQLAARRIWSSG
jgi:hypothetical protein